jgi:hypothetical protein
MEQSFVVIVIGIYTFSNYPEAYHLLITEQEAIGWDHLLHCHFALSWGDLQQD